MDFPVAIEQNSVWHPKKILRLGLIAVSLGFLTYVLSMAEPFGTVPLTSDVDTLPLPFAVQSTSALRGAITDGGSKNGKLVKVMTFDAGEVSEVIPKNALTIALVPNAQDIAHGATLKNALVSGKRVYGYKYSSYSGQAERDADARARTGVPMSFSELFPGQFFASKESRQDGNFISAFEVQKDIVFHELKHVTLERHSRYIFITSDDGTSFSVRWDLLCGNGVLNGSEACDDFGNTNGDGCSSECAVEPGYTCTGTSCQKVDPLCGNGVIDGREECDVGAAPAPGCDNLCRVKTGFSCTGAPSVCVPDLLSLAGWYRTNGLFGNIADPPIAGERYDHAENVSIVRIDDERALAVWSHGLYHFNDSGVSRRAIKASIFDGTTWSAPHTIEPLTDVEPAYCRTCTNPVATADNQGNIHIFWESVDAPISNGGARLNTYARYVSTFDGTNFSQKQKLTLAPYYIAGDLAAAFNENGEGIVAWPEWGSSHNNSNTVFAVRYSPMTGWTPTETVSTFFQSDELLLSGGDHLSFRPGVGIDSSGEATVLYRSLVYITQIHGSVSIYRADLFSRTFSEQAWSPASVVVSEPVSWSGPSNSYPGMTYTRSVNKFAFSMRPDGSALLAYGLTVPSTQQGSMNFPKERVYTKEFKNGAWATAINQQPDTESYRGIQPLIAVNPLSEGGVVAWYENYGNSNGMHNLKLLKNGAWSHPLSTGVPVESMPLFVHWSYERGRYLVAMTHKLFANSSPQGFTQDRGISLTEVVPATNTLLRPYAFLVPHTSDVLTAGVAELAETFVTVWLQPEQRSFLDDPRYYTHQHILRHAVFQK